MARSDLLINLVKASSKGDKDLYTQTLEALIAEERAKHHHGLADKLSSFLSSQNVVEQTTGLSFHESVSDYLYEKSPNIKLDDLYIEKSIRTQLDQVIEEHYRVDLLRSYDLEPRHRLLFIGPPGNGKTSTAEAIAEALSVPFFVVRYETLIGSYLGETSLRIKKVIDFVRQRKCVLFFDEFDAVGKERGDAHETGEIKRVVNSLLLQLDALPPHVTVIAASNHSELLDKAVWRRFQLKVNLVPPSTNLIKKWFDDFSLNNKIEFGFSTTTLSQRLKGASYSELRDFCLNIQRRIVLSQPKSDTKKIVSDELEAANQRGRALTSK